MNNSRRNHVNASMDVDMYKRHYIERYENYMKDQQVYASLQPH